MRGTNLTGEIPSTILAPKAIPQILVYSRPPYSSVSSIKRRRRDDLDPRRNSPSGVFRRCWQLTSRFTAHQYLSESAGYQWVLGNGVVVVLGNISRRSKRRFTRGRRFFTRSIGQAGVKYCTYSYNGPFGKRSLPVLFILSTPEIRATLSSPNSLSGLKCGIVMVFVQFSACRFILSILAMSL